MCMTYRPQSFVSRQILASPLDSHATTVLLLLQFGVRKAVAYPDQHLHISRNKHCSFADKAVT